MKANLSTDDYIPRLFATGILADLQEYVSTPKEFDTVEEWFAAQGYPITWQQIKQFIADITTKGEVNILHVDGDSLPDAITRPAAPTGIGCAGGNVWANPPGSSYTMRFYVDGILKAVQQGDMNSGYLADCASIGATAGKTVSICQVSGGICGWWSQITVPG